MANSQLFLVCDSSTYANFSAWASAISQQIQALSGMVQSSDTGQVMWTGLNISAVSVSGTAATYTYSSLTGLPLAIGRALTITGMTHSANNVTGVITAFTGTTSGTFTVTNASAVAESGSTGVVTAQTAVPGSAAFYYEIWTPNDGLTNFYWKVEYGNYSGTNSPCIRLTVSTTTNGAGTCTGLLMGPTTTCNTNFTPPSTTLQWECDFFGAPGVFGCMLWRNSSSNTAPQLFAIERSINVSGAYTSSYVTMWTVGTNSGIGSFGSQQSFSLTTGAYTASPAGTNSSGGFIGAVHYGASTSSSPTGGIPFSPCQPSIGQFDYPCTVVGLGFGTDFAEAVPFGTTVYGSTLTYLPSKVTVFASCDAARLGKFAVALRQT